MAEIESVKEIENLCVAMAEIEKVAATHTMLDGLVVMSEVVVAEEAMYEAIHVAKTDVMAVDLEMMRAESAAVMERAWTEVMRRDRGDEIDESASRR